MFQKAQIPVIRLGLHTVTSQELVAGPWHPAFSELCYSKIYFNIAKKLLNEKGNYTLYVNQSAISKMIGQRKENMNELKKLGFDCVVKADKTCKDYEIKVERR